MHDRRIDRGTSAAGIVLVFVGLLALVWTVGGSMPSPGVLLPYLAPIALVGLGIVVIVAGTADRGAVGRPGAATEAPDAALVPVAVDLDGASRARIEIGFVAGRLRVGRAAAGHLLDGTIVGGGVSQTGTGTVRVWSESPWLEWVPGLQRDWTIGVTGDLPVDIEVSTGAAQVELDCRELQIGNLVIHAGASAVRVQAADHGRSRMRTEVGAGSLEVMVPPGVAAFIRTTALVGSREIDLSRFPATPGGYRSPGFDKAADRIEIDVQTALGSLRIQ